MECHFYNGTVLGSVYKLLSLDLLACCSNLHHAECGKVNWLEDAEGGETALYSSRFLK